MKLTLRTPYSSIADLTIEVDNTKVTTSISSIDRVSNSFKIDESIIENLISVARDAAMFNDKSDIDFVKEIFETFLNDSEREEFIELINNV